MMAVLAEVVALVGADWFLIAIFCVALCYNIHSILDDATIITLIKLAQDIFQQHVVLFVAYLLLDKVFQ